MNKNRKQCWSCRYFKYDNKCELDNNLKSKSSSCKKHKLINFLRKVNNI